MTIGPPLRAILDSPGLQLDAFIAPGHVSTVIGTRPYDFISRDYGKPVVVTAFEPLDILHATVMIARQLREGRCDVENQYTRVVRRDGNTRALAVLEETMELRDTFEWRGLGWIEQSALKLRPELAAWDAEVRFEVPGERIAGPEGLSVWRGPDRRDQAVGVQGLRNGLHARAADRDLHGLERGSVRRVLQLRAARRPARSRSRVRPRRPKLRDDIVTLAHGSGGKATRALVDGLFVEALDNPLLAPLSDSALLEMNGARLAFTTDSYVVKPLFFPGGDIGELAVNGTVNDLAVAGAQPLALSAGFIIEEGFEIADLRRIAASMGRAAAAAGVPVAAGDTKVVERGKADGLYVTTAGVGMVAASANLSVERVRPGDRVLVSGTLGDHGMAVMVARGELALEVELDSDTAPLHELADALLSLGGAVRWMRDPTRGGLATALNELVQETQLAVVISEDALPIRPEVTGTCEILGIDPLYVASEGRLVAVIEDGLAAQRRSRSCDRFHSGATRPSSARSPRIRAGLVVLRTSFGGSRIVDMLVGDPLPRIC